MKYLLAVNSFFIVSLSIGFAQTVNSNFVSENEITSFGKNLNIDAPDSTSKFITKAVVQDGIYAKQRTKDRHVMAYDHIREADVLWSKRIWREINTLEKMNLPFNYPQMPFINVLLEVLRTNESAKIFTNDDFTIETNFNEVQNKLGSVETIKVYNPVTEAYEETTVTNDFNPEQITKFRIKEDWVFDEETSRMVVRIIAIAPIMEMYDDNDNKRGDLALFWAYYPSFRKSLGGYEVFNPYNDAQRLTWDDLFEIRYFTSTVYKEGNVRDMRIKDYMPEGIDVLMEAEAIERKIFEYEHDLWSY